MPRGQRRGHRSQREAAERASGANGDNDRLARTVIFTKTKMCKFHILGMCSKGSGCKFAHHKEELNPLPDLTRTKLCKTLISTGSCEDPECCYAHNREELRAMPEGPILDSMPEHVRKQFMTENHGEAKQGPEANAALPFGQVDQAALQQMFTGMQMFIAQQQALQGNVQAGAPASSAGPAPAFQQAPSQWPQQQVRQQHAGTPPHAESKVVSLCEGLSLEERKGEAPAVPSARPESSQRALPLQATHARDDEEDAEPRLVVKNTFIDLEPADEPRVSSMSHRSNTWGAGLSSLCRSDSRDSMGESESPSQTQHVVGGVAIPPSPVNTLSSSALQGVPEKRRLFTQCRQVSEDSETSTGTPPRTEKRHQDTPLGDGLDRFSQDSLSTLDEEEGECEKPEAKAEEPHFDYHVKNTFIEFDEESPTAAKPLRAVQTAMGRLDTMG